MADTAYSGALLRSAHYAFRPPVAEVDPGHLTPHETGDIFDPRPAAVAGQAGDVWQDLEATDHSEMVAREFSHWGNAPLAPLPSDLHPAVKHKAETERIVTNHLVVDFRPDTWTTIPYRNAGMGVALPYTQGRGPIQEGEAIDPDLGYLVAGKNAFDYTNAPNEVYGGDPGSSGGRRRLGYWTPRFGIYEFWTKQGQDAEVRAYTGLVPAFPADKPRIEDAAPYTPNSSGTATWIQPSYQDPSQFTLPAETIMTDYTAQAWGDQTAGSFEDTGGRL
jgi:hypothetical protein